MKGDLVTNTKVSASALFFSAKKSSNLSGRAPGQTRAKPISLHLFKVVFKIFCPLPQQSEDQMKKKTIAFRIYLMY